MQVERVSFDGNSWSGPFPPLDSATTLVVAFGAPELSATPESFAALRQAYPSSHIVGCSSAGEIHGPRVLDRSIAVAVVKFGQTTLQVSYADVVGPAGSYAAGEQLARSLARPDLRGIVILSDGLKVNGSELVRGVNTVVSKEVIVTGGLAADGSRFQQTWVLRDGATASNVISAVGFYGDHIVIGHGSKGGWDKFGPERKVTRSAGNVLLELDGEPALALYKKYLGERAAELPASGLLFPLALRASATDDKVLVRTILAVDEETQSMTFAGDIPQGQLVQLMRANFDRLIGAAGAAAGMTQQLGTPVGATLAIAISCVGRRLVLGERTDEELESAMQALPAGTTQVGFYSYGEISPYTTGACDLHNQTMTLTTLSER